MSLGYQHELTTRMHKNSSVLWFSPLKIAANSSEHHPLNEMEMQESTWITTGEQTGTGTHFTPTNNRKNGWVSASLGQHRSVYSAGSSGECRGQQVWCEVDVVPTDSEEIAKKMLIDFTLILLQKSNSTVENLTSTRNGANQKHTLRT